MCTGDSRPDHPHPLCAVLPHKKRRKSEAGRDPLKDGGFARAPRRGDAAEPLTAAEAAAAKIKVKVRRRCRCHTTPE